MMSVFRGNILEYPGVIVDRFNVSNCRRGRVFFLSHCHKDHMSGLDSDDLLKALRERKINFYCSEITLALLSNDPEFVHLVPYLSSLQVLEPVSLQLIPFREDDSLLNITVTLLPAGHCPGSVMFLFEGEAGNVLYTGDFRVSMDELKRYGPLHNVVTGSVLDIRTLYLDTTFCHPKSMNIITRDETRDIIIRKAKEWLDASSDNVLHLDCCSFGYEHIFLSLSSQLNTKIHIDSWKMRSYSILPSVQTCLTEDSSLTRIHACSYKRGRHTPGLPCGYRLAHEGALLHIKPSTQFFVTSGCKQPYKLVGSMYRVMHSMHASFTEIQEFVKYISPTSIIPCVIPASLGDTSLMDLHDRLRSLVPRSSTATVGSSSLYDDQFLNRKRKSSQRSTTSRSTTGMEPLRAESINKGEESISEEINEEVEFNSDYETDDEILSPWDSPSSSSSNHSLLTTITNLPVLSSYGNNDDHHIHVPIRVQPVVSLSFDFDKTPSPVPKKPKQTPDYTTTPTAFIDLTQSSDDTNYSYHQDNDSHHRSHSNSKSPSIIVISDNSPSPVDIISIKSSSLKDTPPPYSVTSTSSLKNTSPPQLVMCTKRTSRKYSSTSSQKDTPSPQSEKNTPLDGSEKNEPLHRSCSKSHSTSPTTSLKDTPSPRSLKSTPLDGSPSVLPLTPNKEDSESLLSKRSFIFM